MHKIRFPNILAYSRPCERFISQISEFLVSFQTALSDGVELVFWTCRRLARDLERTVLNRSSDDRVSGGVGPIISITPCRRLRHNSAVTPRRNCTRQRSKQCIIHSSGVGTMGTGGVHCTPQVQDLYPQSQRCGLCQNFKQTTLTTRLYKVRTNL